MEKMFTLLDFQQCLFHEKNPRKKLKMEKQINISTKVKIHKHRYTFAKRCSEKSTILETDQNTLNLTVMKFINLQAGSNSFSCQS